MPADTKFDLPTVIKKKLHTQLNIVHLSLKDESHLHASHNEKAKKGNTHFYLTIVSDAFKGLNLLQRHQKINAILQEEYKIFHALRIKALSREEYAHKNTAQI